MQKLRKASVILLTLFIITMLVVSYFRGEEKSEKPSKEELKKMVKKTALPVKTEPARKDTLILYTTTTGLTRGIKEADIMVEVSGKIIKRYVEEGQWVRKSQPLFQLDDTDYRVALDEANARLIKAQVEFGLMMQERGKNDVQQLPKLQQLERTYKEKLHQFQQGKISLTELDNAFLEYRQALIFSGKAQEEVLAAKSGLTEAFTAYKKAWLNVQRCKIEAPFSGIVGDIQVEPFEYISAGTIVCKITDLSKIRVEASILESDFVKIKKTANAWIEIPGTKKQLIKGKVVGLSPFIDREKRTGTAVIEIPGEKGITSGMEVKIRIETARYPNLLIVPRRAVLEREGKTLIFVVRDGEAVWNYVKTGKMNDDWVEILDADFGLEPGEPVIVEGHYTLAHKARVKIVGGK
jgi:RND family efflux transporter MFP subunit